MQPKSINKKNSNNNQKKDLANDISLKEILILTVGIITIILLIFVVPRLFDEKPKTMDQLFEENYNKEPTEDNYIYNGFSFIRLTDDETMVRFWYTRYQVGNTLFTIPFRFGPKEVEQIPIEIIEPLPLKDYSTMYITIDPREASESRAYLTLAVSELTEILSKVRQYDIRAACSENLTNACINRPIVNCEINKNDIIVYFQEDQQEKIEINKNCFILYGTNESLVKTVNRFLYGLLGIIENQE
ncbi:MAG: hypothetical protein ACMXYG_06850 [Candidatus Woesearchaeota archaeon]